MFYVNSTMHMHCLRAEVLSIMVEDVILRSLCRVRKLLDFIRNMLICVLKINKGLAGLERHEGE